MAVNDLLQHIKENVSVFKPAIPSTSELFTLENYPKREQIASESDLKGEIKYSSECVTTSGFSVISYNILADCYVDKAGYFYSKDLSTTHRHESLIKELKSMNFATIMCFQEVTQKYFCESLEPSLNEFGYRGVFQQKSQKYPNGINSADGLAIFYHYDTCELVCTEPVILNNLLHVKWRLQQNGDLPGNCYKDTVALLCVLKINGKLLALCNVHIHWDYTKHLLQTLQGCLVYNELVGFSQKYSVDAQLYCGDFNTQPQNELYKILTETGSVSNESKKLFLKSDLKVNIIQTQSNALKRFLPGVTTNKTVQMPYFQVFEECYSIPNTMCSAYKTILGREPKFTNYTFHFKGCLDYILYNPNGLCPVSIFDLPKESDLKSEIALPNMVFQSDHISLKAEFTFDPIDMRDQLRI